MTIRYKFVDDSQTLVAVFKHGDVEHIPLSAVPSGVVIESWWTEQDQADYELAEKVRVERRWRENEIRDVVNRLDQLRNDELYGITTYAGGYTAAEFNAYRAALVAYGDNITESSERPTIEAIVQTLRGANGAS
ncbi:TPA: hypothetical protein ACGFXK_002555 [Vibrio cholerae]|nr:hypothetical protein VCSRO188_1757 [Vibrio cholerae]